jgi:hypothetical protein
MVDLATLSLAEKRELYDQLAFTLERKDASAKAADDEVYDAIKNAIAASIQKHHIAPFPQFLKAYGRGKYEAQAEIMTETIKNGCGRILRRVARKHLLELTLESLIESMIERHIPISPGTLLDQANFLYIAINKDYPGYLRAKQLHRLVPLAAAK